MKLLSIACILLALGACSKAPEGGVARPAGATSGIAWVSPTSGSDVDAAFADAKARNQPVFLFWTAAWCPPCNQVKSTIFTRSGFIEQSRSFVPVYVDGDTPSGQSLGKRFNVSAYPTMVLLRHDGTEVTRLAGSVDPAKYMQLLQHGLAGGSSARQVLAAALARKPLSAEDWRLLAYHSWSTDDDQLVAEKDAPALLMKLATACPAEQRESASRLVLQALAATANAKKGAKKPAVDKAEAIASVKSMLARPELVREHADLFSYAADDIVGYLTAPGSRERSELVEAWSAALDRLIADRSLSNANGVWAMSGKVSLARLDNKDGALPESLLAEVREQAVRADRETTDINERQSVITATGAMLARAGLLDESDALFTAELKRSHSPYYYMLGLASNAKKRGTPAGNAAAIDWARQAYESAKGPATRLQWGGSYVNYLLELAPQDSAQIEKATASVIGELEPRPGTFSGRSQIVLERLSGRLVKWNQDGRHDAVLKRLNAKLVPTCAAAAPDSADRRACEALFTPAKHA
jgi:thioredoxin-like negative regulator of GroEL